MSRGILLGLNQNASNPFVMRGGNINNGTNAGVLNSYITVGYAYSSSGFRAVLCPQHFDTQRRLKTYGDERPCEPPTKASKSAKVSSKPNYGNLSWDKVYRKPVYWIDDERCKCVMNIIQAFMWNVRTYGLLIEFKYIKQEDFNKNKELLNEKEKEAQEQLEKYKNKEEIKQIPKLKAYSVVAIKDKLIVKEN